MHVARVRRAGAAVLTPGVPQRAQPVRRSRARNIASVPCRCGHSCTVGPGPRSGTPGQAGPGVQLLDRDLLLRSRRRLRPATRRGRHHADGLGQVRRAGDVGHHAARAHGRSAAASSSRCSRDSSATSSGWRRQRASGRRRSAPSPVHGASTSTRSNAPSGSGAVRPSATCTVDRQPVDGPAHQLRAVLGGLDGVQRAALQAGEPAEQRRLAAGPGAQVEPAVPVVVDRHAGQRQRHELAALVLHDGQPLADGVELARCRRCPVRYTP